MGVLLEDAMNAEPFFERQQKHIVAKTGRPFQNRHTDPLAGNQPAHADKNEHA